MFVCKALYFSQAYIKIKTKLEIRILDRSKAKKCLQLTFTSAKRIELLIKKKGTVV